VTRRPALRRSITPSFSSARRRWLSRLRGMPGAPSRMDPNESQPTSRLRTTSGVQRSAKISAPLAIGQYWP
jgi:hypothetical protein